MTGAVTIAQAQPADAAAWESYVASHAAATMAHRYAWREVVAALSGQPAPYLLARQSGTGRLVGVLPLGQLRSRLFGHFLVSVPYLNYGGPLADSPAIADALVAEGIALAGQLGVSHLELREREIRAAGWPARTDKAAMLLTLAADATAQFAAFDSKLRAQIRRPEREGAEVRWGGSELLPDFYAVFARNMRDLGTPVYGRQFFSRLLAALGGDAELGVVTVRGEPAAAACLVHFAGTTEIPWASSLREWNRAGVNMLLYWSALQRAIARGSGVFDFGRSTVDAGTYRFKAQWGAKPRALAWNYWLAPGRTMPGLNPGNPRFALAIRAWQRLPVPVANWLGPHIVRHLA
jgi:serine/alanine adding enzyme